MIKTVLVLAIAAVLQDAASKPRVIEKGDQSNMDDARQAVARTAAEWNALWQAHAPDRPQPKVDFAKETVLGVFIGSRPSAGYAVEVVGTREEQGALVVQYRESRPAPGVLSAQVITSAYSIVAIPARKGDVKFERLQ